MTKKTKKTFWGKASATAILIIISVLIFSSVSSFAAGLQPPLPPQNAKELSTEWWQWVYSIPQTVNPLLDQSGKDCVVGQRGDVWFLAGTAGGSATRDCSVPEGKVLFISVINIAGFDSPNTCGQGPDPYKLKDMRSDTASFIDGATIKSVTLDGSPIGNMQRVRSEVFELSLPGDNWFSFNYNTPCAGGIYSPAVADGYYAHVGPLKAGGHTIHIYSEQPAYGFVMDVPYNLTVVPVKLR